MTIYIKGEWLTTKSSICESVTDTITICWERMHKAVVDSSKELAVEPLDAMYVTPFEDKRLFGIVKFTLIFTFLLSTRDLTCALSSHCQPHLSYTVSPCALYYHVKGQKGIQIK